MRGLETARLRLGLDVVGGHDRRARAEAMADGLVSLRQAVERGAIR